MDSIADSQIHQLEAGEAFAEMAGSADRLEAELGRRPQTIAFPYGYAAAAGAREALLAEQAGIAASFTTRPGYLRRDGSRQGLPRVSVNGGYQSTALMGVLMAPALWRLRDRLRKAA